MFPRSVSNVNYPKTSCFGKNIMDNSFRLFSPILCFLTWSLNSLKPIIKLALIRKK